MSVRGLTCLRQRPLTSEGPWACSAQGVTWRARKLAVTCQDRGLVGHSNRRLRLPGACASRAGTRRGLRPLPGHRSGPTAPPKGPSGPYGTFQGRQKRSFYVWARRALYYTPLYGPSLGDSPLRGNPLGRSPEVFSKARRALRDTDPGLPSAIPRGIRLRLIPFGRQAPPIYVCQPSAGLNYFITSEACVK